MYGYINSTNEMTYLEVRWMERSNILISIKYVIATGHIIRVHTVFLNIITKLLNKNKQLNK